MEGAAASLYQGSGDVIQSRLLPASVSGAKSSVSSSPLLSTLHMSSLIGRQRTVYQSPIQTAACKPPNETPTFRHATTAPPSSAVAGGEPSVDAILKEVQSHTDKDDNGNQTVVANSPQSSGQELDSYKIEVQQLRQLLKAQEDVTRMWREKHQRSSTEFQSLRDEYESRFKEFSRIQSQSANEGESFARDMREKSIQIERLTNELSQERHARLQLQVSEQALREQIREHICSVPEPSLRMEDRIRCLESDKGALLNSLQTLLAQVPTQIQQARIEERRRYEEEVKRSVSDMENSNLQHIVVERQLNQVKAELIQLGSDRDKLLTENQGLVRKLHGARKEIERCEQDAKDIVLLRQQLNTKDNMLNLLRNQLASVGLHVRQHLTTLRHELEAHRKSVQQQVHTLHSQCVYDLIQITRCAKQFCNDYQSKIIAAAACNRRETVSAATQTVVSLQRPTSPLAKNRFTRSAPKSPPSKFPRYSKFEHKPLISVLAESRLRGRIASR
eukprot:GILK01013668.1.p1 GENE.GILK01013668.1~~GILK01013668.1.p1  ORF type:complete len:503 (-),score=104.85 GILK01013668.1:90-1598(-)